ncbi:TetR/AcrR family transcriptional regulator [Catenulispora yoronensis]|uniref:TetR/AcrR family transcriptional regulator n=1 Tax=Catenulispora yoronensis TaxID=450799 RepID=A0ABN2TJR3_9ACTN
MQDDPQVFQRARSAEHKQRRAADLLAAARRLAEQHGVGAVTLADTAELAGVHPSAMRRYFSAREELFLRLAAEDWHEWADAVGVALSGSAGRRSTASRVTRVTRVARVLGDTLADRPLFCDLLGHVIVTFEPEATAQAARDYKLSALDDAQAITQACRAALPDLSDRAAADLLATATSLAAMLYQISNPAPGLAELYVTEPRLAHAAGDFRPRLTRLLTATLSGLVPEAA